MICIDHPGSIACTETVGVPFTVRIGIRNDSAEPVEFLSDAVNDGRMRTTVYVRRGEGIQTLVDRDS